jgi:glycosyltransferase involved in cell wall biosynthesis
VDRSRVGLIIPALNEAASVGGVVSLSAQYGVPIVVDDGSNDGTGATAAAAGADVVRHEVNRGYDAALESGFARAAQLGLAYAITLDADGQHDPTILPRILSELDAGADVVTGIRDKRQRLAEHAYAWYGRSRWDLHDPLCGMKGYRLDVYRAHGCFDSCRSIGTELIVYAIVCGYDVRQFPIVTRERRGAPRFGSLLRANLRIFRALALVAAKAGSFRRRGALARTRDRRES